MPFVGGRLLSESSPYTSATSSTCSRPGVRRAPNPRDAQSLRPPPRVLCIGGREGIGRCINGDYELLDGVERNCRPCWLRRSKLEAVTSSPGPSEALLSCAPESTDAPSHECCADIEERRLYLFLSDMGYWTVASALHATGAQVFARNGPDFGATSPDMFLAAGWCLHMVRLGRTQVSSASYMIQHTSRQRHYMFRAAAVLMVSSMVYIACHRALLLEADLCSSRSSRRSGNQTSTRG